MNSFLLLTAAGVAAGLTGTIAGLASLFSYPALLATGLPPTAANVTNTVALAFGSLGVLPGSRRELTGQRAAVRHLGVACAAGAAVGAALVLVLPPDVFEVVVPFLIGGASLAILLWRQPETTDERAARPWLTTVGVFGTSVYGGYFAAASGVLVLALLLATTGEGLLRANALKNVLMLVIDIVAAVGFALFGPVSWTAVLPLAIGLLIGSWLGPVLARRLPTGLLRVAIAIAGLGLAVKLAVDTY
ncbi:hypothetical protein EV193_105464 [Herbihabitans rhizosphaerae]|uniref:Probable membrane transporter protein n=1 Tax=Herbihabitans rhizosphaerae TaxID=1872711 RepID=A0A4Q7KNF4_9PSEU|nr:sulfite exporter TauE/SafE family protein [Herbihabitans rhizosphaerae]RZS37904.1 hypothetical protein EV193_105464 [Herbihabitans rhizosphaerae]